MPKSQPIKLQRIRTPLERGELTYQIIRDAVIHRQFKPDTWIKQDQVCKAIGISRTLVRHALARLASEGLVETKPRWGFRVIDFSDKQLIDLFEVRTFLETGLFERSAGAVSKAELEEIRHSFEQAVAEMKDVMHDPSLWDAKLRDYLGVDRGFHDRLIEATDNQQWIQIYYNIRDKIEIIGYQVSFESDQLKLAAEEHFQIIDSMLAENYEQAKAQCKEHIKNVLRSVFTIRAKQAEE